MNNTTTTKGHNMKTLKNQRGHMSINFIYWIALVVGSLMSGGGIWLLVFAVRGLRP